MKKQSQQRITKNFVFQLQKQKKFNSSINKNLMRQQRYYCQYIIFQLIFPLQKFCYFPQIQIDCMIFLNHFNNQIRLSNMFSSKWQDAQESPRDIDEESILKLGSYKQKHTIDKKLPSRKKINRNEIDQSSSTSSKSIIIILIFIVGILVLYYSLNKKYNNADKQWQKIIVQQEKKIKAQTEKVKNLEKELNQLKQANSKLQKQLTSQRQNKQNSFKSNNTSKPFQISKDAKGAPSNVQNPNILIDITYPEKDFLTLPIDPLRKNSQNKTIADILYATDDLRKQREDFQKQRISYVDSKSNFPQLFLVKYNVMLDEQAKKKGVQENEKEWGRLNSKFNFKDTQTELPMCIVMPGYNNNARFRIQYNLNSVFLQNYTNYKVVVINDASTDGSDDVYRKYFSFHRIPKDRYFYIANNKRVTALQNIYLASLNQCGINSIVVTLDADDEFIGRNVLQVFNWGYQTKKSGVIYTNFYWYQQQQTLMYGFTSEYNDNEKKNNLYRNSPMKFSHLRSYRTELLYQVDPKDLQDEKGVFFTIAYDMALFFPLMELSCGRVNKIQGEFHYLYNTGTGLNDYNDRGRQVAVDNKVRGQKKYSCYQDFNDRMSK